MNGVTTPRMNIIFLVGRDSREELWHRTAEPEGAAMASHSSISYVSGKQLQQLQGPRIAVVDVRFCISLLLCFLFLALWLDPVHSMMRVFGRGRELWCGLWFHEEAREFGAWLSANRGNPESDCSFCSGGGWISVIFPIHDELRMDGIFVSWDGLDSASDFVWRILMWRWG